MTAKEYLKQYEQMMILADMHKATYEETLETIDAVRSSANIDGMPHGNGIFKPVEDKAIRLSDAAMRWKMAVLDALEMKLKIYETICMIDGIERTVLVERYIRLRKWEEICVLLGYSWHGVHSAHRRGLAKIQAILDKRA